VRLYGNDSVTLAVEVPPALRDTPVRGTPVLFVEARALRNPRGARVYVEMCIVGAEGREHEAGSFTFFGMTREADKQAFALPLEEPAQLEALAVSEAAQVRAAMKPFGAETGDVSDVRVDLRVWIEVR
jgi:hypothetical protein